MSMKNMKSCVLRFDRNDYPDKEKLLTTISKMLDLFDSDEMLSSMNTDLENPMCKNVVIEINYPKGYNFIPQLDYQEFLRLSDLPF